MKTLMRNLAVGGAMGLAAAMLTPVAQAADISGAGATFPYPVYAKWADAYKKETGIGLNYQSIGSGGGIKQIKAKTVTFGASDAPLKGEELMAGRAAVVSIDLNPGKVVLFGLRPQHRAQTHATFPMLFNALYLSATGDAPPKTATDQ